MKKSAYLSDVLFAFLGVGLPLLCYFRYLRLTLPLAVILAALAGGAVAVLVGLYLRNKHEKGRLKAVGSAERERLMLHLSLCNKARLKRLFDEYAEREEEEDAPAPFYLFTLAPATADGILPVLREKPNEKKRLFCNDLTPEAARLCEILGVEIVTADGVYERFKAVGLLPEKYLGEGAPTPTGKERLKRKPKRWFSKRNSRRFLTGGAFVLFASLLSPFPTYYLIFGSILVIAALFVRIFGYR